MPSDRSARVGERIFVIDSNEFEIIPGTVRQNPGDHLWVNVDGRSQPSFFGPMCWAKTREEATAKAIDLLRIRMTALRVELTNLKAHEKLLEAILNS